MGIIFRLIIAAFFATFALPQDALACRFEVPSGLLAYEHVAVVSVEQAEPVPNPSFNIWRLRAKLQRTVIGTSKQSYEFQAVTGSNGCSDGRPQGGELWVLYFGNGDLNAPEQVYALDYVRAYDSRLGEMDSATAVPLKTLTTKDVRWRHTPSGRDVARAHPISAQRRDVEGFVSAMCRVTAEGKLSDCTVETETPSGEGFGAGALQLMRLFQMETQTTDGAPVSGAIVHIPVRFALPKY